jgi:hypothetical protein
MYANDQTSSVMVTHLPTNTACVDPQLLDTCRHAPSAIQRVTLVSQHAADHCVPLLPLQECHPMCEQQALPPSGLCGHLGA